ncbi:hypothetical protein F6W96_21145 [Nocardia terpenica]|uniref:DUF4166 domain-containing protein n=1 Tax=Nocardia terpenica TaxID=455432 RepID=A0A6G9ZG66_9NOCA|nr:hypothetical protein F6W96_21145 [Nocardia terpenica]
MSDRWWASVDRATRWWWRLSGREVDLDGGDGWLRAPIIAEPGVAVGDRWLAAEAAVGGGCVRTDPAAGLLPDMDALSGAQFDAARVHPGVRDFYEHTARWRMEAWVQWSPILAPGGWLISRMFGRRVGQFALPVRPLDTARGIDSRVETLTDRHGVHQGAAWLRTSRLTGEYIYSGFYRAARLPGSSQPSVHVSFPLPMGNVQVFLRPVNGPHGSLQLLSPTGSFGSEGCYVTVTDGGRTWAARIPIYEQFHVYRDGSDHLLRTDHVLRLRNLTALRLHYLLITG